MKVFLGFLSLLSAASLLTKVSGFIAAVPIGGGTASARNSATGWAEHGSHRNARAHSTPSATKLFAKKTYKNFEEMLEKEPGALLVDFYATWCGPCQQMGETLTEVGPKMKDELKIMKIDTDKYPALTEKFEVAGLPTLILFKDGKELNRIEGFLPGNQLVDRVRYFLQGAEVAAAAAGQASAQGGACSPPPPPQVQDACIPPAKDACTPPPRDACAPPSQE